MIKYYCNEIQSVFEANITDEENTEFKETHPDING